MRQAAASEEKISPSRRSSRLAVVDAETRVGCWRDNSRLPFPDHDESLRFELSGTLDYPPEGSAGNKRRQPDAASSDSSSLASPSLAIEEPALLAHATSTGPRETRLAFSLVIQDLPAAKVSAH